MTLLQHYFLALMTVAISAFGLGLFVLGKNPNQPLNRRFCVFQIFIACWSFGEAMQFVSTTQSEGIFWNRFEHVGVAFIPATFLHFVFTLLDIAGQKRRQIQVAYLYSALFSSLLFNYQFLPPPTPKFQLRYCAEPGPLYYPFVVLWLIIVIYALVTGFHACTQATGERKNRFKYFFIGAIIGFAGGSPNFLLAFDILLYPLNPF